MLDGEVSMLTSGEGETDATELTLVAFQCWRQLRVKK